MSRSLAILGIPSIGFLAGALGILAPVVDAWLFGLERVGFVAWAATVWVSLLVASALATAMLGLARRLRPSWRVVAWLSRYFTFALLLTGAFSLHVYSVLDAAGPYPPAAAALMVRDGILAAVLSASSWLCCSGVARTVRRFLGLFTTALGLWCCASLVLEPHVAAWFLARVHVTEMPKDLVFGTQLMTALPFLGLAAPLVWSLVDRGSCPPDDVPAP